MAKVLNATAGKAMPTVKFATVLKIELRINLNKYNTVMDVKAKPVTNLVSFLIEKIALNSINPTN